MGIVQTFMGIVDTTRISAITLAEAAIGRRVSVDVYDDRLLGWARKILGDAEVTLDVRGRENAGDGSEPLIVMSNHQSLYDIPVLFCTLPGRVRMVAKKELFDVPIFGGAMRMAGFICIDRSDRRKAIASLRDGGELLKKGTCVWIAPEGTRSPTGELGVFKSGGFRMALETGCRILPIAIDGTRHVLPAKAVVVRRRHRVVVTIGSPIDPKAFGAERRKDLMRDVRRAIAGPLGQAVEQARYAVEKTTTA